MRLALALAALLLTAGAASAQTQTHLTVPTAGSSFLTDLQAFLRGEDALRFADMFSSFVASGGTAAPTAGLTLTPAPLVAYPGGYYVTESGSIPLLDNTICWVIVGSLTTGSVSSFTRVAGTHYLVDCSSPTQPTTPAGYAAVLRATTLAGAVTAVTDLRRTTPVTAIGPVPYTIGDLLCADSTNSLARIPLGTAGQPLIAASAGSCPSYAALNLATAVTGVLPAANGGLGASGAAVPAGYLPIGNGSGWTFALPEAGGGLTITPLAGRLIFTATGAAPPGYRYFGASVASLNSITLVPKTFDTTGTGQMALEISGALYTFRASALTLTLPTNLTAAVALSGSWATTSGSKDITSSVSQSGLLFAGETIVVDPGGAPQALTVRQVSGTTVTMYQAATATTSAKPAQRGGQVASARAADALYFVYAQPTQPIVFYIDSAKPNQNYHPRNTTHRWTGIQVYNNAANQLESWTYRDGVTTARLADDGSGNRTTTTATYAYPAATLYRPMYFPSGGTLNADATWQVAASGAGTGAVALGTTLELGTAPTAQTTFASYNGGTANKLSDSAASATHTSEICSNSICYVGLAYKADGANALTLVNGATTGTSQSPAAPVLLLRMAD